jgi:Fe-S-cluster-containing hydrogenase component 2
MSKEHAIGKASGGVTERKGAEGSGVVFDMPSCGGCRTCELACSFHHTQEFIPSVSSLKVLSKEEGPGYQVLLVAESRGKNIACDGCKGLDVPLCMEYCKEMDDLGKILLTFEERRVQEKE